MSDMFPKTSKTSEPQNESPNNPLPPCSWSSNMQTYITPQSTSAGFCSYPSGMLSQAWSRPLQFDSLHDPRRLSNYHMVSEGSSAMSFSEKLLRVYGGKNLDSIEKSDENLQPKRLATNECEENVKRDSTPEINCAASETGGSQHEHHDANSGYRSTKKVLQGYPSTKKQQCNTILGNGQVAQKKTDPENCNVVEENKKCGSQANSTNLLNQNLETDMNAADTNPQLQKLESLRKKERKREQNRESSKRRKMRKEQETEELRKRVENLRDEVSELRKELLGISEQSEEVQKENESLMQELVEKYGEESIADLINKKPAAP
ncbi:PREDICTED: G-box-binding factor 1-like [Lupinus angustifolius]|uniref:G-box-binding factor 1-like n=1 Tax=Lupinus angustifolius TaxID=3871 RepID=UPI00092F686E|nr:PREDICTED: G-box-binding factor 1-like [Lupinus angustifolius]